MPAAATEAPASSLAPVLRWWIGGGVLVLLLAVAAFRRQR